MTRYWQAVLVVLLGLLLMGAGTIHADVLCATPNVCGLQLTGGSTPVGSCSDGSILFNNGGVLGCDPNYVWDDTNSAVVLNTDLYLKRDAAANLQLGLDSTTPAGSATDQVLSAADATGANGSGADLTVQSGAGNGNGAVSKIVFQTPNVLAAGGGAQTLYTTLTLQDSGAAGVSAPQALFAAGTAALPIIAFSGATTTGFWLSGVTPNLSLGGTANYEFGASAVAPVAALSGDRALGAATKRWSSVFLGDPTQITDSTPFFNAAQTWNDAADTFIGMTVAITDTASKAASRLFEIKGGAAGATDRFYVGKGGKVFGTYFTTSLGSATADARYDVTRRDTGVDAWAILSAAGALEFYDYTATAANRFDIEAGAAGYANLYNAGLRFADPGTSANSHKLLLLSDNATVLQTSSLQGIFGADPYLRISAPNDAGAETAVLDVHDTVIAATSDTTVDLGSSISAGRLKDLYLGGAAYFKRNVEPNTSTKSPAAGESMELYTNEGAGGNADFSLPTAVTGLTFTFCVQEAKPLNITANTGDTIRIGASVSAAAGTITSSTIGSCVTLTAINITEWFATSSVGTWSF